VRKERVKTTNCSIGYTTQIKKKKKKALSFSSEWHLSHPLIVHAQLGVLADEQ